MDYVEWVEKVLQAAVQAREAADKNSYDYGGTNLRVIGALLGFRPEDLASSEPDKPGMALIYALRDLAGLGLMEAKNMPGNYKLTREGRRAAQEGLSSMWGLITSIPLDEDQIEVLRPVVEQGQVDYGSYVGLQEVVLWERERPFEGPVDGRDVFLLLKELDDDYQMVFSRNRAGMAKALPAYRGVVYLTRSVESKQQALIRELLVDWETTNVDFKQEVHLKAPTAKAEFVKDVLALVTTKSSGRRFMVIGFDDDTREFLKSVDPAITKDRIEDILGHYTSPVPEVRYDRVSWQGGYVGLIEVIREAHKLPYRVNVDMSEKVKAGDVFVRRGSHTRKLEPSDEEYQDLVAEGDRARLS